MGWYSNVSFSSSNRHDKLLLANIVLHYHSCSWRIYPQPLSGKMAESPIASMHTSLNFKPNRGTLTESLIASMLQCTHLWTLNQMEGLWLNRKSLQCTMIWFDSFRLVVRFLFINLEKPVGTLQEPKDQIMIKWSPPDWLLFIIRKNALFFFFFFFWVLCSLSFLFLTNSKILIGHSITRTPPGAFRRDLSFFGLKLCLELSKLRDKKG